MRRADTVFEYAGHPETRENINNPFNKLMGKVVEVFLGKEFGWKRGRVIEFHAFDGLHVIEFEDKMVCHISIIIEAPKYCWCTDLQRNLYKIDHFFSAA